LLEDIIAMLASLVNLVSKVYPDHIDYMDNVLQYTINLLQQQKNINQWVDDV